MGVRGVAGYLQSQLDDGLSQTQTQLEQSVTQQDSKLRTLKAAIGRIGLHVKPNAALKKLQKGEKAMGKQLTRLRQVEEIETFKRKKLDKWVRGVAGYLQNQLDDGLSQTETELEQSVKQQDSKLRSLKAAIGRIGLHVNSNPALRKLQKREKAIQKQLTHLRRAEEIETLERNKKVRSAMAALKKEEKIVTSKEVTAVKQLHAALRKLMNRLLRRPMAQFKEELSRAKVEGEHRVEHQNFKLRKLK